MPFKSEAQRRWMEKNRPDLAKQWEAETKDTKLPDRVKPKQRTKTKPPPKTKGGGYRWHT